MAHASVDNMTVSVVTDRDVERVLVRCVATWAVAGVLLVAFVGPLYRVLSFFVFVLWVPLSLAGAVLGALALQHVRHASSPAVGLLLAVAVPGVAAGLWYGGELLRAGGDALARWVSAI